MLENSADKISISSDNDGVVESNVVDGSWLAQTGATNKDYPGLLKVLKNKNVSLISNVAGYVGAASDENSIFAMNDGSSDYFSHDTLEDVESNQGS